MYDYRKDQIKGTTPYVAPTLVVYENKKFKFDEIGNIKAIVDIETTQQRQTNAFIKWLVKLFAVLFIIFISVDIVRAALFTFSVEKWQKYPFLRVTMQHNLMQNSAPNFSDSQYIQEITFDRKSFTEDENKKKFERLREFKGENAILFKYSDEVEEIFGEPVLIKEKYSAVSLTDEQQFYNDASYGQDPERYFDEYFYAYDFSEKTYYFVVHFYDNVAIGADMVTDLDS